MNHKTVGPAVQKAYTSLRAGLDGSIWQMGDRLPSIKRLACSIGVSEPSLLKAIARLKAEKLLHGIERGPIRAGAENLAIAIPFEKHDAMWQLKRIVLEKDILSGMYAHQGKLPSSKELRHRYGCSHDTLRKILRAMCADGVVFLRRKSYFLTAYKPRRPSERIVFITHRARMLRSALNKEEHLVLKTFEGECIRRGFNLETLELDFYNSLEIRAAAMGDRIKMPALGYVLDIWWFTSEEMRISYIDLLRQITESKSPVALIDELGTFVLPIQFTLNPLLQVFVPEGKRAGARMARHLIDLGHRSVAYLSMAHKFSWSQERFEGIREQCSFAGLEHAVVPVVTDEMDVAYQHILALSGFPDAVIRKVISIGASKSQAKSLYNAYLKFKKEWTPRQFASRDIRDFQRNLSFLISPLKEKMSEDFFDGVYSAFIVTAVRRLAAMSLTPLFQQALNKQSVTAWICASDDVALAALSFLKDHRIAVPGSLSVAGFDDRSYESLEHRLTTFDFNVSGAVHNMLNFIARPPRPRGPYRHCVIEVEGMVVERGTTGRPE